MPDLYRAFEIWLGRSWTNKIDIWAMGFMVRACPICTTIDTCMVGNGVAVLFECYQLIDLGFWSKERILSNDNADDRWNLPCHIWLE